MSPIKAIELVSRANQISGKALVKKLTVIKNGDKHSAQADTLYEFVVDGKAGLPNGTKIIKRKNELAFELPDGRKFEIADWCGTNNSQVVELLTSLVYDEGSGKWIDGVEAITSNACAWIPLNGGAGGIVGAAEGFVFPIGALAALPALALAAAGGGGSAAAAILATASPSISGLTQASNSGSSADQLTKNNRPSLSGKGQAGSKITVTMPNGEVAQTTVDGNGNWVVTLTQRLPEGLTTYSVVAQATGATPSLPATASVMVDTIAPIASVDLTSNAATKAIDVAQNGLLGGKVVELDTSLTVGLKKRVADGSSVDIPVGPVTVNPDGTWSVPASIVAALPAASVAITVMT